MMALSVLLPIQMVFPPRYLLLGIFLVFYTLPIVYGLMNHHSLMVIVPALGIAALLFGLWFGSRLINQVLLQESDTATLTASERWVVLVTEFLNPLVVGAFYYHRWKKKFPNKATQAGNYGMGIFLFQIFAFFFIDSIWREGYAFLWHMLLGGVLTVLFRYLTILLRKILQEIWR
ncbi:MAG: hypothetical protein KGQ93_10730 [Cyanobacteria bacterium REEB459]|nr:hypothetical protein [Cyanobacteria bacterium REEB459]